MKIILPDNTNIELDERKTALDLALKISEGLARNALACKINGEIADLRSALKEGDKVEILTAKNPEAVEVLRHSCSHIMAQAVQNLYPEAKLAIGPAIENGFYYDFDGITLSQDDLAKIETEMKRLIKEGLTFEKHEIPDAEAQIEEFKNQGEIYKAELLEEHKNEKPTLYITKDKEGKALWNDLCRGPHLLNSKAIKAFKLLSVAGAYWRGDEGNKMLQRVYATAFLTKEELAEHLQRIEEAQKRDHRKLAKELDLFSLHDEVGGGAGIVASEFGSGARRDRKLLEN